jgi:hypothetical protein
MQKGRAQSFEGYSFKAGGVIRTQSSQITWMVT